MPDLANDPLFAAPLVGYEGQRNDVRSAVRAQGFSVSSQLENRMYAYKIDRLPAISKLSVIPCRASDMQHVQACPGLTSSKCA